MRSRLGMVVMLVSALVVITSPAAAADTSVNPYGALGEQKLDWQVCDWYQHPSAQGPDWSKYPVTYCADMKAPMDWYNPARGFVTVRVTKVAATGGAQRRGILLFNPGGPGSDGSTLATTKAKSQPELAKTYDLIGFAPRGVAPSTTLDCGIDWSRYVSVADERDRSQANTARQLENGKLVGQACGRSALAPYVTTDQTARDMDLIRAVLGEPKLNYFGYSYGTWLGSWYAALFKSRADRFVLDSNQNWTSTMKASFVDFFAFGLQRRFDQQFLPWLGRHDDKFGLGDTVEKAKASFERIRAKVSAVGEAAALDLTQAITLYRSAGWPQWATNLKILDADPSQASTLLLPARTPGGKPDSGTHWAVRCGDTPWSKDPRYWTRQGDALGAEYPLTGAFSTEQPCAYYPHLSAHPVHPDATNLPRMLMVQDQLDPATIAEGAITAAAASAQPMVYVRDAGDHTA